VSSRRVENHARTGSSTDLAWHEGKTRSCFEGRRAVERSQLAESRARESERKSKTNLRDLDVLGTKSDPEDLLWNDKDPTLISDISGVRKRARDGLTNLGDIVSDDWRRGTRRTRRVSSREEESFEKTYTNEAEHPGRRHQQRPCLLGTE